MAQKSGFFNALLDAGVYDRTYNADDYSDNLAVIIGNGVLRSANDDLKVTAVGLNLTVNAGRAWINGHYYNNTTAYSLPAISTPTGASRIDRVVLRLDNTITGRTISIQYLQGTAATSPVAPALTRNDQIYELCLADILVDANAVSVTVIDRRGNADLCGWVYSVSGDGSFFTSLDNSFNEWFEQVKNTLSSVTLFKRYKWQTTIASTTTTVSFNIPQYDAETCFIEVYVNGLLTTDYTQSGTALTFTTALNQGTELTVYCFKSIDGTGIMTVSDEITQLQNEYATLDGVSKYVYKCTGVDDNISLSEIAQAIYRGSYDSTNVTTAAANAFLTALGGNAYLQGLQPNSQITIEVVGKLGATTAAYGAGTSSSRYRYFNFSVVSHMSLRLIFDFAKCDVISIDCADNTSNIIFYGTDLRIKNASVEAQNSGSNCDIAMVIGSNVGVVDVQNCNFEINTTSVAKIAEHGTFIDCSAVVKSSAGNAFCFAPNGDDLIRVIGGRFLAYAKGSGTTAAIFITYADKTNAVTIAQNINCPTISLTGYFQQYLSVGNAGKTIIDNVVSTMNSTGSYNTIVNQVWLSKTY